MDARHPRISVAIVAIAAGCISTTLARDLTFEERVKAQEAIERVYYAHQIGAKRPFDEAVPRVVIETKVTTYLAKSAALDRFWGRGIDAVMLRDELMRMTRETRLPDRLKELFAALHDDAFLIQECLARSVLVDRMVRDLFASDREIHAAARLQAEHAELAEDAIVERSWSEWWDEVAPELDPASVRAVASLPVDVRALASPSVVPCPTDDTWTFRGRPTARKYHAAVWTGSVMVVWGGMDESSSGVRYQNSGGRYEPATDSWTPTSKLNAPAGRANTSAVWTGTEMLVWGGYNGFALDTGGRYDPVADTWAPISRTSAPTGRMQALAVYTGTRLVIWGGNDGFTALATGGRYDPATDTWTPTSNVSAPTRRDGASAVWTGTEMIVFGGAFGPPTNSGGRYNPATDTWTATATLGAPSPRSGHTAVWTGSRMLVWGGSDAANNPQRSGAAYDPATNTWVATGLSVATPDPRAGHKAVWTGSRMVVWGGWGLNTQFLASGGRYDPSTNSWSSTSMIGAPTGRDSHTAVWTGSLLLVWGGTGSSSVQYDDGRRYDPASDTWSPLGPTGAPQTRWRHSAVWTGNLMVVWGGEAPSGLVNTGGRYDPATASWTPTSTTGAPPPRAGHQALWTGNVMIVWGPTSSGGRRYDPIADSWLPLSTVGAPSTGTAVWADNRMLAWGSNGGRYDPVADVWSPMTTVGAPSIRSSPLAVWTGTRMVVWGGQSGSPPQYLDTGGRYDPVTDTWSSTSMTGAPPPSGGIAVWAGGVMVIWAHPSGSRRYNPDADTWAPVATLNAPGRALFGTIISTGPLMVAWGGTPSPQGTLTDGRYDPVSNTWTSVSAIDEPIDRYGHSAVWTGRSMLIWGGDGGYSSEGEYVADPDLDGDGFNACGGDCSQRTASVYPGATQVCDGLNNDCSSAGWPSLAGTNEADNDQDGLSPCQSDCDDSDSGALAAPVEVSGVAVSKPTPESVGVSWDSQGASAGSGTSYDIVSGALDDLLGTGSFSGSVCLASDQPPAMYEDGAPQAGSGGAYYLVRANNACGSTGYGDASMVPDPRDALDASSPCP